MRTQRLELSLLLILVCLIASAFAFMYSTPLPQPGAPRQPTATEPSPLPLPHKSDTSGVFSIRGRKLGMRVANNSRADHERSHCLSEESEDPHYWHSFKTDQHNIQIVRGEELEYKGTKILAFGNSSEHVYRMLGKPQLVDDVATWRFTDYCIRVRFFGNNNRRLLLDIVLQRL